MPNPEHLAKLLEGVEAWNEWRKVNTELRPDLNGADLKRVEIRVANLSKANLSRANLSEANLMAADLSEANLSEANLSRADLMVANLSGANLGRADLSWANLVKADLSHASLFGTDLIGADLSRAALIGADLREANLFEADLSRSGLREANLSEADLSETNLRRADLRGAKLAGANLSEASLVGTNLKDADLTGCNVFGTSVWNVTLEGAKQSNLLITRKKEAAIRVDNLEVAQFIYLLLANAKIRHVIDTIASKVVLILGRFTPERKAVLEAIREELRRRDYVPVLFDFDKPSTGDTHETIVTLAGLARFVIADISGPKSVPQELGSIVPTLPSVPVQPLLQTGFEPWGMYDHIKRYGWVLPLFEYQSQKTLLHDFELKVIAPAEEKAKEQTRK